MFSVWHVFCILWPLSLTAEHVKCLSGLLFPLCHLVQSMKYTGIITSPYRQTSGSWTVCVVGALGEKLPGCPDSAASWWDASVTEWHSLGSQPSGWGAVSGKCLGWETWDESTAGLCSHCGWHALPLPFLRGSSRSGMSRRGWWEGHLKVEFLIPWRSNMAIINIPPHPHPQPSPILEMASSASVPPSEIYLLSPENCSV